MDRFTQQTKYVSLITIVVLVSLTAAALASLYGPATVHAQTGLILRIGSGLRATEGETVTVPIGYISNGADIAAVVFSIDFDEACFSLDPRDENQDGRPDAIAVAIPAGLFASITYDSSDTNGEIDVIIADYFPPFATLADSDQLLAITFDTICVPPAGGEEKASVNFSTEPAPSFGGTSGQSVTGTTTGSTVTIISKLPPPTPTPTITPTPTFVPTAPPTTPTATPTIVPTATPATIVDRFTGEIQEDGVLLRWQTSREVNTKGFAIHRLPLGQAGSFVPLAGAVAGQGNSGGSYSFLDDQVDADSLYSYLLVEEKSNGRFVAYYDLLVVMISVDDPSHQVLLPLILH